MVTTQTSACKKCRERKVKCDKSRPSCRNCTRLNYTCVYEIKLKWRDDPEREGKAFGREKVWTKNKGHSKKLATSVEKGTYFVPVNVTGSMQFLNVCSDSIIDTDDLENEIFVYDVSHTVTDSVLKAEAEVAPECPEVFSEFTRSLTSSNDLSVSLSLNAEPSWITPLEMSTSVDDVLYQFYTDVVLPSCTLYDDRSNGFRYVILPMASNSPILLQAVLAVSASAYSNMKPSFKYIANFHKLNVLEGLLELMKHNTTSSQLEILAIVMLLCIFELKNGCSADWMVHMKGAIMYCREKTANTLVEDELTVFAKKYFIYQIFNYLSVASETDTTETNTLWPIEEQSEEIDGHLGCSMELLRIVAKISRYAFLRSHHKVPLGYFDDVTEIYEKKLLSIRQISPHLTVELGESCDLSRLDKIECPASYLDASLSRRKLLILAAEARRQAALIYFYSTFYNLDYLLDKIQTRVRNIASIFNYVADLEWLDRPTWGMACLMWPAFVAGVHAHDFEDICAINEFLITLKNSYCLGNVVQTISVLETVWLMREEVTNMNSDKLEFNKSYERFLDPIRWRISLG